MNELKARWEKFSKDLSTKSQQEQAMVIAEVIGSPIDADKPINQAIMNQVCDFRLISKDNRYFYFRITSPRVKQVYAIGSNGEVTLVKIAKEGLQTLTVSPLNTPVAYMPINDVMSAEGYDAVALMRSDVLSSMDLAEFQKFFAVLAAAVPVANKIVLASNEEKFGYQHLQALRKFVKDYADKFLLIVGSDIDEDILSWDFDENKYRSIADLVKDLNVEVVYAGNYTLKISGTDTPVVAVDKAWLIGVQSMLDGKPFVVARKELANKSNLKDAEIDSAKQRMVQTVPTIIDISNQATAALGYWGYEEFNVVCRMPLALAEFTRTH
jgi:hypothetical protein